MKLHNTLTPEDYFVHLAGIGEWDVLSASALLVPRRLLAPLSFSYELPQCTAETLAADQQLLRVVLPPSSLVDRARDCKQVSPIQEVDVDQCMEPIDATFESRDDVAVCGSLGRYLETRLASEVTSEMWAVQRREAPCA
jgi:hypothetical protein